MKPHFLRHLAVLFTMIAALIPPQTAAAQTPSTLPVDPAAVARLFDGLIPQQLADASVPGAVVTVVKDDRVLFSKGYGLANLEQQLPVEPENTVFRIGSITKLFTWTAVMQLAEQGKLDLDTDINQYLDFHIPATFPQPVTLKHLMSHTAGFEDGNFQKAVHTPAEIGPMGAWLRDHQPRRVFAPGRFIAYSNYGTQLAAYIVQRVSGLEYADTIEQHILQPLEMTRTSSHQPGPASLAADLAVGYAFANGSPQAVVPDYDACPGAGNMTSTGADMARFMLAHLQDDSPILKPGTARQMHSALFSYHPRVNGFLYGFYEMNRNGLRIYGHSGDVPGFNSLLALLPEENLGIFIAYNGETALPLRERALEAFVDHFFPVTASTPPVDPSLQDAPHVAGCYHSIRSSYTTVEKVMNLLTPYCFTAQPDGSLLLEGIQPEMRYVEVEPLLFQLVGGEDDLIFTRDDRGNHRFAAHDLAVSAIERFPWYEDPNLHLVLIGVSLLTLISYLAAAGIRGVIHILSRRKNRQPGLRAALWAERLLLLDSGFVLLFLVLFILALEDPQAVATGDVTVVQAALACSTLVAISLPVVILAVGWLWKCRVWGPLRRLHYTLGSLAVAALAFSFWVWNLIGWKF
jgi:CubicO group peptidase (beta-lactamase class C family)